MKPEDARTVDELIASMQSGVSPEFLHFWGHTPREPGKLDQSCLSNWFPADFQLGNASYPTTEHYMMAEKARLFGDDRMLDEIINADSPGEAKSLGRKVNGFDGDTWESRRFDIVVKGNLAKFHQNQAMGEFLLQTGNKVIVEASPRDRIWGIGMGKNNENADIPEKWRGSNLLGFALMEVRSRLSKSS